MLKRNYKLLTFIITFVTFGQDILNNDQKTLQTTSQNIQWNNNLFTSHEIQEYSNSRQLSSNNVKTCQYRQFSLPQEYFEIWAASGCYSFTRPDLIVNPLPIIYCTYNNVSFPVLNVNNTCEHRFSSKDPTIQKAVQNSFSSENIYNRWLSCVQDAVNCCENYLIDKPLKKNYCSPVWDGWTCFSDYTKAGENQEMVCSKYAYVGTPPQCNHYSIKTCFANATWNDQSNYSTCAISPRIVTRTQWHIAMLSISIIASFPGLLILLIYKQLYTQKYFMIRNLIIAIIWRNLFVLLSKSTIIMDELTNTETTTIMANNGAGCRILTFFEKLAANFVFTCMLLEGIYLHQLLTNVFGTRRNAGVVNMLHYYIIGIFISVATVLVWAVLMAVQYNNNCWAVTDDNNLHWINDSPRLAMLLINIVLLGHIVIVMWQTFRSKSNEDNPGLRTAKASLICLPLFGVPFFFILFRPATESCGWEQFYYFVSYALEGLQCIFVVVFYCYLDREVHRLVKRSFILLQDTLNFNKNKKRNSKYEDRRTTFSTTADSRPNIENAPDALTVPVTSENFPDSPDQNTKYNAENNEIGDISRDPLYLNLPPISSLIVNQKFQHQDELLLSLPSPANYTNDFYVNNDKENMFDNFYNNQLIIPVIDAEQSEKGGTQLNPKDKFKDDMKLDPKLFFKNRAHGIEFLDDDNKY